VRSNLSVSAALGLGLLLLGAPSATWAQTRNETQILAIDGVPFARALDLEGDLAAMTAFQFSSNGGINEGLYFFEVGSSGTFQASPPRLLPSDYEASDQFGQGLAISGNRLAVSGYNHTYAGVRSAGAAWIFERDASGHWVETAEISQGIRNGRFGYYGIALDGDTLAGVAQVSPGLFSLYIYERDGSGNWNLALETPPEDFYNPNISLSGDTLVLGLPKPSSSYNKVGEVRIYQRQAGSWALIQNLLGSGTGYNANTQWGRSTAIYGDTLAFASNRLSPGEVLIYRRQPSGLFTQSKFITWLDGLDIWGVQLSSDRLVVPARNGKIYVYSRNLGGPDFWGFEVLLASSVPTTATSSGVAISGTRVLAQLRYTDGRSAPGIAAIFDVVAPSSTVNLALSGPSCTPMPTADLLATVESSHEVDTMTYQIGSAPAQTLCIGCGVSPQLYVAAAPLVACGNTVTVTATDILGLSRTASHSLTFDGEPPLIDPIYCSDRMVLLPAGRTSVYVPHPRAVDNCDTAITSSCGDGKNYPLGTTPISCTMADACGNSSSCSPNVTVVSEDGVTPGGPDCLIDDFGDAAIDPAWTLAAVGDVNQHSAAEGGGVLELTADGSTAFYGSDNAGFLYREMTGDFRAEVTIDGSTMTSGGAIRKAGLMVRQSLDTWDVRLIAELAPFWQNSSETHLQFVARTEYGGRGSWPVAQDVVGVPQTVRLAVLRTGNTLAVEYSTDGSATWIRPTSGLGGSITIPDLAPKLLVGLDMVSNNVSVTSTARFDDASICPATPEHQLARRTMKKARLQSLQPGFSLGSENCRQGSGALLQRQSAPPSAAQVLPR